MSALDEIFKAFDITEDEGDKSEVIDEKEVKAKSTKMVDKPQVIVEQSEEVIEETSEEEETENNDGNN